MRSSTDHLLVLDDGRFVVPFDAIVAVQRGRNQAPVGRAIGPFAVTFTLIGGGEVDFVLCKPHPPAASPDPAAAAAAESLYASIIGQIDAWKSRHAGVLA